MQFSAICLQDMSHHHTSHERVWTIFVLLFIYINHISYIPSLSSVMFLTWQNAVHLFLNLFSNFTKKQTTSAVQCRNRRWKENKMRTRNKILHRLSHRKNVPDTKKLIWVWVRGWWNCEETSKWLSLFSTTFNKSLKRYAMCRKYIWIGPHDLVFIYKEAVDPWKSYINAFETRIIRTNNQEKYKFGAVRKNKCVILS